MISEHDDLFTPGERRALRLWRAPEPPADFAARVLGGLHQESESVPAGSGSGKGIAAAAAALVLVGSLFTARLLSSAPHRASMGGIPMAPNDGGPTSEVSSLADGIRS